MRNQVIDEVFTVSGAPNSAFNGTNFETGNLQWKSILHSKRIVNKLCQKLNLYPLVV